MNLLCLLLASRCRDRRWIYGRIPAPRSSRCIMWVLDHIPPVATTWWAGHACMWLVCKPSCLGFGLSFRCQSNVVCLFWTKICLCVVQKGSRLEVYSQFYRGPTSRCPEYVFPFFRCGQHRHDEHFSHHPPGLRLPPPSFLHQTSITNSSLSLRPYCPCLFATTTPGAPSLTTSLPKHGSALPDSYSISSPLYQPTRIKLPLRQVFPARQVNNHTTAHGRTKRQR